MGFNRNFQSVLDVRFGGDSSLDALLLHFMTENNLEYTIDPDKNASAEQLKFVVALREGEFYAPCSDWMFLMLLKEGLPRLLLHEYILQWRAFIKLSRDFCPDRNVSSRFIQLARYKFRMALASPIVIPSRLLKRFMTIFMSQSGIDDPYRENRRSLNRRADAIVRSQTFDGVINAHVENCGPCDRIDTKRFSLDMLEVERLMRVTTLSDNWTEDGFVEEALLEPRVQDELRSSSELFAPVYDSLNVARDGEKRILYIPSRAGSLIFDLQVVRCLLRLGHRVVMALKEGFFFEHPTFWDRDSDPVLAAAFNGAWFVSEDRLSKNELLNVMAKHQFVVISEGTRERFNPYRCSVTFSRAWKESDLILARGADLYNRLIQCSHSFTRDIVNFFRDDSGTFHLYHRPKAAWVHKFSERYINEKADEIITEMRRARLAGKTVMFYSGIIGSVPGQTRSAIEIMTTFVAHLRSQLDDVHIINPGEHFEEGMDGDDLMFMWEKVQRSGYIDVWRFQTHFDIEKSFALLGRKVPPVWTGKDATYSTGCTKEMHIALDVLKTSPELQIIGPNAEKFFRRREYGVGKYCDVAIDSCVR